MIESIKMFGSTGNVDHFKPERRISAWRNLEIWFYQRQFVSHVDVHLAASAQLAHF